MANQQKRFVSVANRRTGLPGDDGDPRRVRECMQHSMNAQKCKTLGKLQLVLVYAAYYVDSAKESAYTIRVRVSTCVYDVLL